MKTESVMCVFLPFHVQTHTQTLKLISIVKRQFEFLFHEISTAKSFIVQHFHAVHQIC